MRAAGQEARERGFTAVKTNMFTHGKGGAKAWMADVGSPFEPGLDVAPKLITDVVSHGEALRDGLGDDVEVLLDLNFNARTEGVLRLLRALEHLELFWVELDLYNPHALAHVRSQSRHPIASCEKVFGVHNCSVSQCPGDRVAIVDTVWSGVWQSMKMASTAEAFDMNVAPHNFYGHLSTMRNVPFAAAVPNLRVMETDIDRLPWDDELFTTNPQIVGGAILVPSAPGWGIESNEDALRAHPPVSRTSYLGLD